MRIQTILGALIIGACLVPQPGHAYTVVNGLISVNHTFATYLRGGEAHGDWTGAGYGYSMPSTIGFAAGNHIDDTSNGAALDGSWVQENGGQNGVWDGAGSIWDLGYLTRVIDVFPFIDHVNPPETALLEGTEFRVYGSNDLTTWSAATFSTTWDQGYNAATIYDDYTSRWTWGTGFRYIGIVSGNYETGFLSGDAEIDGVAAPVPEPASLLLLGTGLVGLVGSRLRRKA